MRTINLLCLSLFVATLAAAQASKPVSPFDQQLIDQQQRLLQSTASKDAAWVASAMADDFQGIAINGDFYGKDEVIDAAQSGGTKDTRAYDFRVVRLNDDSGIVAYNLILPGGHPRYCHMADTWVRVNGQWKLKFRQITPNLWSANDLD